MEKHFNVEEQNKNFNSFNTEFQKNLLRSYANLLKDPTDVSNKKILEIYENTFGKHNLTNKDIILSLFGDEKTFKEFCAFLII